MKPSKEQSTLSLIKQGIRAQVKAKAEYAQLFGSISSLCGAQLLQPLLVPRSSQQHLHLHLVAFANQCCERSNPAAAEQTFSAFAAALTDLCSSSTDGTDASNLGRVQQKAADLIKSASAAPSSQPYSACILLLLLVVAERTNEAFALIADVVLSLWTSLSGFMVGGELDFAAALLLICELQLMVSWLSHCLRYVDEQVLSNGTDEARCGNRCTDVVALMTRSCSNILLSFRVLLPLLGFVIRAALVCLLIDSRPDLLRALLLADEHVDFEHILGLLFNMGSTASLLILGDPGYAHVRPFASREECQEYLKDKDPGCFLVRVHSPCAPSKTNESLQFLLSFKSTSTVKHAVIRRDASADDASAEYTYRCGSVGPFNSLQETLRAVSERLPNPLLFNSLSAPASSAGAVNFDMNSHIWTRLQSAVLLGWDHSYRSDSCADAPAVDSCGEAPSLQWERLTKALAVEHFVKSTLRIRFAVQQLYAFDLQRAQSEQSSVGNSHAWFASVLYLKSRLFSLFRSQRSGGTDIACKSIIDVLVSPLQEYSRQLLNQAQAAIVAVPSRNQQSSTLVDLAEQLMTLLRRFSRHTASDDKPGPLFRQVKFAGTNNSSGPCILSDCCDVAEFTFVLRSLIQEVPFGRRKVLNVADVDVVASPEDSSTEGIFLTPSSKRSSLPETVNNELSELESNPPRAPADADHANTLILVAKIADTLLCSSVAAVSPADTATWVAEQICASFLKHSILESIVKVPELAFGLPQAYYHYVDVCEVKALSEHVQPGGKIKLGRQHFREIAATESRKLSMKVTDAPLKWNDSSGHVHCVEDGNKVCSCMLDLLDCVRAENFALAVICGASKAIDIQRLPTTEAALMASWMQHTVRNTLLSRMQLPYQYVLHVQVDIYTLKEILSLDPSCSSYAPPSSIGNAPDPVKLISSAQLRPEAMEVFSLMKLSNGDTPDAVAFAQSPMFSFSNAPSKLPIDSALLTPTKRVVGQRRVQGGGINATDSTWLKGITGSIDYDLRAQGVFRCALSDCHGSLPFSTLKASFFEKSFFSESPLGEVHVNLLDLSHEMTIRDWFPLVQGGLQDGKRNGTCWLAFLQLKLKFVMMQCDVQ